MWILKVKYKKITAMKLKPKSKTKCIKTTEEFWNLKVFFLKMGTPKTNIFPFKLNFGMQRTKDGFHSEPMCTVQCHHILTCVLYSIIIYWPVTTSSYYSRCFLCILHGYFVHYLWSIKFLEMNWTLVWIKSCLFRKSAEINQWIDAGSLPGCP